MKNLRWIVLVLLILVGLVFLIPATRVRILSLVRGEPHYDGKLLSAWKDQLVAEQNAGLGMKGPVAQQLLKGGKEALPILVPLTFTPTGPMHPFDELLADLGADAVPILVSKLKTGTTPDRQWAAHILKQMGDKAQGAAVALGRASLDDDNGVASEALEALANIGPRAGDALPELKEVLKAKKSPQQLAAAARALANVGPEAKSALPLLVALLGEPGDQFHVGPRAAEALAKIGPEALDPLRETLQKSPSTEARRCAAIGLGKMGPAAKSAIPDLAKALHDQDGGVRAMAGQALAEFGPLALPVLKELIAAVQDPQGERLWSIITLEKIGTPAAAAVPALIDALKADPKTDLPDAARKALEAMGEAALPAAAELVLRFNFKAPIPKLGEKAMAPLLQLLAANPKDEKANHAARGFIKTFMASTNAPLLEAAQSKDPALRRTALSFMTSELGKKAEPFIPVLIAALKDKDDKVRQDAFANLKDFGAILEPHLIQMLRGADEELKRHAIQLTATERPQKILVGYFRDEEKKESKAILQAAALALVRHRAYPKDILPHLLELAEDPKLDDDHRAFIARALGVYGREARHALPWLTKQIKIGDPAELAMAAYGSLTNIQVNKATLPLFILGLDDKNDFYRYMAARALGKADFAADQVVPLLIAKLEKDDSQQVVKDALLALEKLGSKAKKALPSVLEILKNRTDLRADAMKTLAALKVPAKDALPAIETALSKHGGTSLLLAGADALGSFGAEADSALPLLKSYPPELAAEVALAHWRIKQDPKQLEWLIGELKGKNPAAAAQALSHIGPPARNALKPLLDLLRITRDDAASYWAMKALAAIDDPQTRQAIPIMIAAVKSGPDPLRQAAAESLAKFGEHAAPAVTALVDMVNDWRSPAVREAAGLALLRIDAEEAERAGVVGN